MKFFESYKKQILIVLAIFLLVASVFTAGKTGNANFIESTLGFIVTPLQKVSTNISSFFDDKFHNIKNQSDLKAENEELKSEIERLERENKRLSLLDEENKKLSALLEIAQKYAAYDTTASQIIAKDPGNWYNIFVMDKGTKDGISANMVLTAEGGLVGKITEAGYTYSKGMSILDSRSSVSAMSVRTGDLGIVKGDYTLMNDGLCKMEYINSDAEIMEGDEIITSHLSDVYPPGISIGVVKEVKTDSNGLTKYAIIEPHVDFKHLDTILIISENGEMSDGSSQNEEVED